MQEKTCSEFDSTEVTTPVQQGTDEKSGIYNSHPDSREQQSAPSVPPEGKNTSLGDLPQGGPIENNPLNDPPTPPRKGNGILNWILYGVVYSTISILLSIGMDLISKIKLFTSLSNHLPDILIIAFAVAVNLRGLIVGSPEKVPKEKSNAINELSIFVMVVSIALYCILYSAVKAFHPSLLWIVYSVSVVAIIASACIGIFVERVGGSNK